MLSEGLRGGNQGRPGSGERVISRNKWIEREKKAGILGQTIYGLIRRFKIEDFKSINGLQFGQYLSVGRDQDSGELVIVLRSISSKMKTAAAETRVSTFPKDFLTQMFDGFEFLGASGPDAVMLLAQVGASESAELGRFVKAYEELALIQYEEGKFKPRTLEEAAKHAGLSFPKILGLLSQVSAEYGSNLSRLILHTSMPNVIKRLAEQAMDKESPNFKAQELLVKAAGMIDVGPKVQINNNNQVNQLVPNAQLPELDFSGAALSAGSGIGSGFSLPGGDVKQLEQGNTEQIVEGEIVTEAQCSPLK